MDTRQQRMLERLSGILIFMDHNTREMADPPPMLVGKRRSLEQSIARLKALQDEQNYLTDPGSTVEFRRDKLRNRRMIPLRDIARPLLKFAPGAAEALRVPHAHASARTVAAAAARMVQALKPHAALLRSANISHDFLREMLQEARGLALAVKTNADERRKRANVTRDVARELKRAFETTRTLGGLVKLHYPTLEERWDAMDRISPPVGRPRRKRTRSKVLPS